MLAPREARCAELWSYLNTCVWSKHLSVGVRLGKGVGDCIVVADAGPDVTEDTSTGFAVEVDTSQAGSPGCAHEETARSPKVAASKVALRNRRLARIEAPKDYRETYQD